MEIKVNGINVNYIDEGKGTPVLFLQGWGTNIELYKKLTNKIATLGRIIAIDLPGFGKTAEPNEAWNVEQYSEFVKLFIKALGLKNVVLMGHSFGGRVIIKLMSNLDNEFKVEKIVLLDSAGIKPKATLKQQLKQRWFKVCKKVANSKICRKIKPGLVEKLQSKHGSADYRKATPLMRQVMVKAINEDLTEYLPNIKVPTLLVWGDMDTATPLSDAKIIEERIPDAGLVVLKNTGHYSFLEDFYTFSRVIESFLGGK